MKLARIVALGLLAAGISVAQDTAAAPEQLAPGLYAVITTSMGGIVAQLYEDKAPLAVKNFIALATGTKPAFDKKNAMVKRHYYDGLTFHRVIKGFMIQTGDVNGTGTSVCGVAHLKDEIDRTLDFSEPGRLAMANTGRPNTSSCQFFITVGRPQDLTGKFTIFGQVVQGQEVADRIANVPTLKGDKPFPAVTIKSVEIKRQP